MDEVCGGEQRDIEEHRTALMKFGGIMPRGLPESARHRLNRNAARLIASNGGMTVAGSIRHGWKGVHRRGPPLGILKW